MNETTSNSNNDNNKKWKRWREKKTAIAQAIKCTHYVHITSSLKFEYNFSFFFLSFCVSVCVYKFAPCSLFSHLFPLLFFLSSHSTGIPYFVLYKTCRNSIFDTFFLFMHTLASQQTSSREFSCATRHLLKTHNNNTKKHQR